MRLIRLELRNFRQHEHTAVEFGPGLLGIIGPNGAGKTTLLEAIAWAIYGSGAARGTNDTLRYRGAAERAPVQADLTFEAGGREYRVLRSLSSADVWVDGVEEPVATTIGGASDYLEARLGMTREEFFNTYFTAQKDLEFLAQMGPAGRGRFLNRVLGYDRIREAQEAARQRRNALRSRADGVRAALASDDDVAARVTRARERHAAARDAAAARARARDAATVAEEELRPRWQDAVRTRDEARDIEVETRMLEAEVERARADLARAETARAEARAAAGELERARPDLDRIDATQAAVDQLAETARLAERRAGIERARADAIADATEMRGRLDGIRRDAADRADSTAERQRIEREVREHDERLEAARADWTNRRQETETRLQTYLERARELKQQLRELHEAGPDGVCPTCERPLGSEYDRVVGALEGEWERLVQDGKWLRQRANQLEETPPEVARLEEQRTALREQLEQAVRREATHERLVADERRLSGGLADRERQIAEMAARLDGLPEAVDEAEHARVRQDLARLRDVEKRAAALRPAAEAEADRAKAAEEARARVGALDDRRRLLAERRAELAFDPDRFAALEKEYETARRTARAADVAAAQAEAETRAAAEALTGATAAAEEHAERKRTLAAVELDLAHHNELDAALTALRADLNARVRPELADLAGAFVAEVTDGRYSELEIDEDYRVLVVEEGAAKPVISGGEEDLVNLVVRLALSQMIAERAGQPFNVLILDEVFGSLDERRRDNVVRLLHHLRDRFDQIVVITHVESIREALDRVVSVRFDPRTRASLVG